MKYLPRRKAYRCHCENIGIPRNASVLDILKFEEDELGNVGTIEEGTENASKYEIDLSKYNYLDCAQWVCFRKEDCLNYTLDENNIKHPELIEEFWIENYIIILDDTCGGYLILMVDNK